MNKTQNKDNWTRATELKDYQQLVDKPTKFYTILCRGGKVTTGFPVITTDENNIVTKVHWNCGKGAASIQYMHSVIGFQPIEIPDDLIKQVLSNSKSKSSYFVNIYGSHT